MSTSANVGPFFVKNCSLLTMASGKKGQKRFFCLLRGSLVITPFSVQGGRAEFQNTTFVEQKYREDPIYG
jgi:hypothetical protein